MTDERDGNIIDITEAVEARKAAEAEALGEQESKDGITSAFIAACLNANERGDGTLFAARHRGKCVFDVTSEQWYYWTGHYWGRDKKLNVFELIEEVCMSYLEEAERIEKKAQSKELSGEDNAPKREALYNKRDAYRDRVRQLRGNRAPKCLTWAYRIEDGLKMCGEEFDVDPWLLACKNGVIELRTGRFREGRPGDNLSKAAPVEWLDIETPAPQFEDFLNSTFGGNQELIGYLRRLFGYAITGLSTEHILPVLHGEGRNGKGTLVETIRYVLGDLAQPIQSEMLLDQRGARSSSGPSPDIMTLKGLRIAFASETDEGRKFSTSRAKWLSGGDTLTGRNPHDRYETVFEPTHLLCLLTNHLPHAPGDDFAFWQRIHLIPFKTSFVDNPVKENERLKVKDIREKLKAEAPGILAWLVRGCIEWQQQGLNPPPEVLSATEDYRMNEDLLAQFIEAYCHDPELDQVKAARTAYKEIYTSFKEWYEAERGDYPPKKARFSEIMERRFKKVKVGGTIYFHGISLKTEFERS